MAFYVLKIGGDRTDRNYREFTVDFISDIADLPTSKRAGNLSNQLDNSPCAIGSTALVIEGAQTYILSPSDHWVII